MLYTDRDGCSLQSCRVSLLQAINGSDSMQGFVGSFVGPQYGPGDMDLLVVPCSSVPDPAHRQAVACMTFLVAAHSLHHARSRHVCYMQTYIVAPRNSSSTIADCSDLATIPFGCYAYLPISTRCTGTNEGYFLNGPANVTGAPVSNGPQWYCNRFRTTNNVVRAGLVPSYVSPRHQITPPSDQLLLNVMLTCRPSLSLPRAMNLPLWTVLTPFWTSLRCGHSRLKDRLPDSIRTTRWATLCSNCVPES